MNTQTAADAPDTDVATAEIGDNSQMTMDNVKKKFATYGKAAGMGANSRPACARLAIEAGQRINGITPQHADELWAEFQKGASKAKGVEYSIEASATQQVSKVRQFIKLGCCAQIDGVELFDRGVDVIREFAKAGKENPMKGSAYDNLVALAREQLKNPEHSMTDDDIRKLFTHTKDEKSALDKLTDLYKKAVKAHDWAPHASLPEIEGSIHALERAITAAGGQKPVLKSKKVSGQEDAADKFEGVVEQENNDRDLADMSADEINQELAGVNPEAETDEQAEAEAHMGGYHVDNTDQEADQADAQNDSDDAGDDASDEDSINVDEVLQRLG